MLCNNRLLEYNLCHGHLITYHRKLSIAKLDYAVLNNRQNSWRNRDQGPLYWHGLNFIPVWINNYISYDMRDAIIDSVNGATKMDEWYFPSKLYRACVHVSLLGFKLICVSKMTPNKHRWSLRIDKWFQPTPYGTYGYLSMLGLKLIYVQGQDIEWVITLITRFIGPTWGHLGPTGPRWAPCWPHELCYLGMYHQRWFGFVRYITITLHWINPSNLQIPRA